MIRSRPMINMISFLMGKDWMARLMKSITTQHTSGYSMCYSTTGLPYANRKVSITHTDSGSTAWGGFNPEDLVAGMPFELYRSRLETQLQA
jgi:uncharacterized protein (DUF169 family)